MKYLHFSSEKSKELFEIIDDLDFLLPKKLIKGSNYQILVGKLKIDCVKEHIAKLNPDLKYEHIK